MICGNGFIIVKIESVFGSGFVGVVFCESIVFGVKQVMILINLNSLVFWVICIVNDVFNNFIFYWWVYIFWLKLECIGNYICGYISIIGNSFFIIVQIYLFMDVCLEIGMVIVNIGGGQMIVVFSNVMVEGGVLLLVVDEMVIIVVMDCEKFVLFVGVCGFEQLVVVEVVCLFLNLVFDCIIIDLFVM